MADKKKNKNENENEFYEVMAQVADFVHDRVNNKKPVVGLNNSIEEYAKDEEE